MTSNRTPLHVYLVDDEPLALRRLTRLLDKAGRVEISGSTTNPEEAITFLSRHEIDAVFLDIQMPGMTGFELLAHLPVQPMVIFTTAFDQYALNAFKVNSIDYLLKPVEAQQLDRALTKLERLRGMAERSIETARLRAFARELTESLKSSAQQFPRRVASRVGDRVVFVDVASVTHFYAKDKLTYAATNSRDYVIDNTIAELEQKLDPAQFIRIHRSTLLNLNYIDETASWFGGGLIVRLKDAKHTELQVARDRVRELRSRLDF
jgi:two-component system LytT family response regulator